MDGVDHAIDAVASRPATAETARRRTRPRSLTTSHASSNPTGHVALLRDLVVSGHAHPGNVVTHHGSLAETARLFDSFDRCADGVVKAVLNPA